MDSDQAIASGCFGGLKLQSLFKGRSKQIVCPVPAVLERNVSQPAPSMKAEKDERDFLSPSRDSTFGSPSDWRLPDESVLPPYTAGRKETLEGALAAEQTIDSSLDELEPELHRSSWAWVPRELRPRHSKSLTAFMHNHRFNITLKYLGLETAWKAEFSHGLAGRSWA
ncbi:hypothetical protein BT96DRAFT_1072330 [Gymnopus androsaceus JB14]|uniref:Uncharacterized protein n=1 Tax=Gymnopus androsaceus JB14 TaxID=1447944 RepID=A0A6A4GSY0_9AGAR|nr:hypothetical protein BT96DRAFT_1072330 [Gymnopus androsaceus JB14]